MNLWEEIDYKIELKNEKDKIVLTKKDARIVDILKDIHLGLYRLGLVNDSLEKIFNELIEHIAKTLKDEERQEFEQQFTKTLISQGMNEEDVKNLLEKARNRSDKKVG